MSDLWQEEGFGSAGDSEGFGVENDWDEGEESIETDVEDGLDELDDEPWDEEGDD